MPPRVDPVSLFDLGPAPFYAPHTGRRDEMVDRSGAVRAPWQGVHEALMGSGAERLRADAARIQRTLHSHGATFHLDGGDPHRWSLDPIPMVLERSEWSRVGRALAQRARVLELVLADVFGDGQLMRSGLLPIDAIVTHRDYLRPCIGVPVGGGRHLVQYAADLARTPQGSFVVLADRTQAPSGAGYSLENRDVLSSSYRELLRSGGVEPLHSWFSTLRASLAELAPPGVEDPRIVMLTPGPLSETYFEHGLLSRTLGYTLVQSADLTVRDGHVFLKSVTGLEPVHVILRRQDAEWCDSLELRGDSLLGIPGLVEAARRRNVSVVNPLGSGLAENPALLACIGELTRVLLGEEPLIDAAPTWWCGHPSGRSHVLANLSSMVIKFTNRGRGRQSIFGRLMSTAQLKSLGERIRARPHLYVGQEEQLLPTAPTFDGQTVVPRYAVQRAFLVADGGGFAWMDGGLTRVAAQPGEVTMSTGGLSKDTWIVAPPEELSWAGRRAIHLPQVDLRASVTSSAAESMYWMGRNLERCEAVIRLVRAVERTLALWPELRDEAGGAWITTTAAAIDALAGADEPPRSSTPPVASDDALLDPHRERSLVTSLGFLVEGSRSVRELLSTDAWSVFAELEVTHGQLRSGGRIGALELAESALVPLNAISGIMAESMVRDPGWRFFDLGRRLERSMLLCQLVGATLVDAPDEAISAPLYETVLAAWDCLGAYRRRHRSDVERAEMLALLFEDASNPRSARFQLDSMVEDLEAMPDVAAGADSLRAEVASLVTLVDHPGAATLGGSEHTGAGGSLELAVQTLFARIGEVADRVELDYFAQVGPGTVIGDSSWAGAA